MLALLTGEEGHNGDSLAWAKSPDFFSHIYNRSGQLMSQDHRWFSKGVKSFECVKI
jgi:hypothetical protein